MAEQKLSLIVDIDETGAIKGIKGIDTAMADSTKRTETETKKGFAAIKESITNAATNIKKQWMEIAAAAVAAYAIIKKAGESVKIAADFNEQAEAVEKRFGKTADEILSVMRRATKGMISDAELLKATSRAMAMGVTTDLDEIATLWQYADTKAKVLGKDTEEVFAQMADGIGKQNPRLLKELGFTSDAFKETTEGVQTTMTRTEMLQAVLAEAGPDVGKFGDNVLSASDQFKVLNADMENAKLSLGQALLPVFEAIVPLIKNFVAGITSAPNALKVMGVAIGAIIPIAYGLITALGPIGIALAGISTAAIFAIEKVGELERARKESEALDDRTRKIAIARELQGYESIIFMANLASKRKKENTYKEFDAIVGGGKISAEWQKQQDQKTIDEADKLRAKLAEDERTARKDLENAKNADRSFYNKKRLDAEEEAAQDNYNRAKLLADSVASYEIGIGKKTAAELERIEADKAAKRKREQDQYDKEYKEVQDFLTQTEGRGQDDRLVKISAYLKNELRANGEQGAKLIALRKQIREEITGEYLQTSQNEINAENQKYEEIKSINKGNNAALIAIEKKHAENLEEINLSIEDKEKARREKKYEKDTKYLKLSLEVASQVLGAIDALATEIFSREMARIDEETQAKLDAIDTEMNAKLDAMDTTNEFREALAEMDEEDKQAKLAKLADERDAAILAGDDVLAKEKQREIDRINLQTQADAEDKRIKDEQDAIEKERGEQKDIAEKDMAMKKWKYEVEAFNVMKAIKLAEAVASTAAAVAATILIPPAAIAAGIAGAVQIGIIASQKPPPEPKFAMGGTLGGSNVEDVTSFLGTRGETIINTKQGQNLFDSLSRSGLLSGNTTNMNTTNTNNNGKTYAFYGPVTIQGDGEFADSVNRRLAAGGNFT